MKIKYKFIKLEKVDKAFHCMLLLEQIEKQKWYSPSHSNVLKKDILLLSQ